MFLDECSTILLVSFSCLVQTTPILALECHLQVRKAVEVQFLPYDLRMFPFCPHRLKCESNFSMKSLDLQWPPDRTLVCSWVCFITSQHHRKALTCPRLGDALGNHRRTSYRLPDDSACRTNETRQHINLFLEIFSHLTPKTCIYKNKNPDLTEDFMSHSQSDTCLLTLSLMGPVLSVCSCLLQRIPTWDNRKRTHLSCGHKGNKVYHKGSQRIFCFNRCFCGCLQLCCGKEIQVFFIVDTILVMLPDLWDFRYRYPSIPEVLFQLGSGHGNGDCITAELLQKEHLAHPENQSPSFVLRFTFFSDVPTLCVEKSCVEKFKFTTNTRQCFRKVCSTCSLLLDSFSKGEKLAFAIFI